MERGEEKGKRGERYLKSRFYINSMIGPMNLIKIKIRSVEVLEGARERGFDELGRGEVVGADLAEDEVGIAGVARSTKCLNRTLKKEREGRRRGEREHTRPRACSATPLAYAEM